MKFPRCKRSKEGSGRLREGTSPINSVHPMVSLAVKRGVRWAGSDKRGPNGAVRRETSPMGIAHSTGIRPGGAGGAWGLARGGEGLPALPMDSAKPPDPPRDRQQEERPPAKSAARDLRPGDALLELVPSWYCK